MQQIHVPLLGIPSASNSMETDQAQQNVGPDQSPNCLQSLSSDDKHGHLEVKS